VRLAGAGLYFDDRAASGAPVTRGAPAWPEGPIPVHEVAIRDGRGLPRPVADVDADFLTAGQRALGEGCHLLAHVLLASKTGLSAPSRRAVDALVALAPDRVDVVVDACQMRTPFAELGEHVRRGHMLQVSGSKFLTGPPFSGALVVPSSLRQRAAAVGAALASVPGMGHTSDWTHAWASRMPEGDDAAASFGPIFRWLPALLEAELLAALPENFRREAFVRFRDALLRRLSDSPYLRPIATDPGDDLPGGNGALERLSILSFQVLGRRWDGTLAPLGDAACRRLFELLNRDVGTVLRTADVVTSALARLQAHIGQPVRIGRGDASATVLRMVLGARFFTIVGYAGDAAAEAALQSEIADAQRAIDKVELLAEHWWRFERRGELP
jgi:hypothetical protein